MPLSVGSKRQAPSADWGPGGTTDNGPPVYCRERTPMKEPRRGGTIEPPTL